MANSKKTSSKAATVENSGAKDPEAAPKAKSKRMSKAEAQEIVNRYSGINGTKVPEELQQAREALYGSEEE